MAALLFCGGVAFVACPTVAKAGSLGESVATNITAYNISQDNCEAYHENYLSAERWASDYAAKVTELQGIVSELDSLGEYVDGDYSVDYNALTYISDVQVKIDELTNMRDVANQKKKEAEQRAAEERAKRQREREATTSASYSSSRSGSSYSGGGSSYGGSSGKLTRQGGVNYYNGQKETYYNLNMSGVISNAQSMGIQGNYWVRNDGVKMYGDYVIVAAQAPKNTIIETSLGTGLVLDYCPANTIDIAVSW